MQMPSEKPVFRSLSEHIVSNYRMRPEAPAFLVASGDRSVPISWRQFAHDIFALILAMRHYGVAGEAIGILGENSYEWVVVHAACVAGGMVAVPLDPVLSPVELAERLAFVNARFVVHSALYAERAAATAKLLPGTTFIPFGSALGANVLAEGRKAFLAAGEEFLNHPRDLDEVCSIVFTSGTTSKPRGVQLTLRNFSAFASDAVGRCPVHPGDSSLMVLPLHHIFGICTAYFLLANGAALGICPDYHRLFDAVQRFHARHLFLVPALAEILAEKIERRAPSAAAALGSPLDWILTGGAPLPRRAFERLNALGIRVLEGYGLTESCSLFSIAPYNDPRPGTAGRVGSLVETCVSSEGELLVRGPNVMRGYLNEPDLTAISLRDGWLHTGDAGTIDADGYVRITGRINRTIVLDSGQKIAPEELEAKLLMLPGIREVVVHGEKGSRSLTSEIYAVVAEDVVRSQVDALNRTLPIYKRIRDVVVRKEPFPRTASGKIKIEKKAP